MDANKCLTPFPDTSEPSNIFQCFVDSVLLNLELETSHTLLILENPIMMETLPASKLTLPGCKSRISY